LPEQVKCIDLEWMRHRPLDYIVLPLTPAGLGSKARGQENR
jgi:hypothetical protein